MKKLIAIVLLIAVAFAASGCLFTTQKQLQNKIPRINGEKINAELNTIYGVGATLVETDVKWVGDQKTVGSQEIRVTSPLGGLHTEIHNASTAAPGAPAVTPPPAAASAPPVAK